MLQSIEQRKVAPDNDMSAKINRSDTHLTHSSNNGAIFSTVFSRCLMVSDSAGCLPYCTPTTTVRRCRARERRVSRSCCRALRFPANCALSHAFGPCGRETAQIHAGLGPHTESVITDVRRAHYHRVLTHLSPAAPSRRSRPPSWRLSTDGSFTSRFMLRLTKVIISEV